jgi:hypothetical protein
MFMKTYETKQNGSNNPICGGEFHVNCELINIWLCNPTPTSALVRASPRAVICVILHTKIWMKKCQNKAVWLTKMVLAQHNCIGCGGKSHSNSVWTCINECNKHDLTAARCFWLAHHNNWSRWFGFLILVPWPICCPNFSFMGGVAKKEITKLGCEKYFWRTTY